MTHGEGPRIPSRSPGIGCAVARWWAHACTLGLPPEERSRRIDEIESDLWEQSGSVDGGDAAGFLTQLHVVFRVVLGVPADISWGFATALTLEVGSPTRNALLLRYTFLALAVTYFAFAGTVLLLGLPITPSGIEMNVLKGSAAAIVSSLLAARLLLWRPWLGMATGLLGFAWLLKVGQYIVLAG